MPNSLTSPPVRPLLDRLFQSADSDDARRVTMRERHPHGRVSVPESDGLEITCRL
jgi:hypothetical protein